MPILVLTAALCLSAGPALAECAARASQSLCEAKNPGARELAGRLKSAADSGHDAEWTASLEARCP